MSFQRLILTDDKDKAFKILEAIYRNKGYCPCSIEKVDDNKCPCKKMIEQNECHCGLYEKVDQ